MKRFVIVFILIFSSALFPAAEFEILPKLGVVGSWTDLTKSIYKPKIDLNFQAGYEFPINKGMFKGFGLLLDFGIDVNTLSIAQNSEKYKINQIDTTELYTGLAFKFVLGGNTSIVDMAFGVASGVKFIPIIDDFNIKPSKIPFSPYVRLFLEDRIYSSEKIATVVGLDISYEYMFFDKADRNKLFAGYDINKHHSLGLNLTIGVRFGNR